MTSITLTAAGEPFQVHVSRPAGPGPGVVVLHSWWGLVPDFVNACDRLAAEGYCAVAPDLHGGKVAATVAQAEQLADQIPLETRLAAVAETVRWLREQPGLAPGRVALLGFSLGGFLALRAAAAGVSDAAITYYGTPYLGPDATIPVPVLGHFAEVDEFEPPEAVAALSELVKPASLKIYPGTGHWFAEESQAAFHAQAAAEAWAASLQFLDRQLKG